MKRRGLLTIWFDPEMAEVSPQNGKRGRQQSFRDTAFQTCLTMNVLFGLPLRQTTGFVQSLLRLVGLDRAAPDSSTLCRPLSERRLQNNLPSGANHAFVKQTEFKRLLGHDFFR